MRYLVVSDIHANLQALEAVLAAAGDWDSLLVLGDLVGYGADPNAVVDRIRELAPLAIIRGNHDKASCGLDDGSSFNHVARLAAAWTEAQLTPANRDYLRELPPGPAIVDDRLELCHGAPFDEDHYIFDMFDAERAFGSVTRPLCVFGHTHLPVCFTHRGETLTADVPNGVSRAVELAAGTRYLLNPGSVGQPRDGDSRAAFAIYEAPERFLFRRVVYDVAGAQARIAEAGLPHTLATRLALGR